MNLKMQRNFTKGGAFILLRLSNLILPKVAPSEIIK